MGKVVVAVTCRVKIGRDWNVLTIGIRIYSRGSNFQLYQYLETLDAADG